MATIYVTTGGTYTAEAGDIFIIDPSVASYVEITGNVAYEVQFNETNTTGFTLYLSGDPTVSVADGVSIDGVNLDTSATTGDLNVVNIGSNVTNTDWLTIDDTYGDSNEITIGDNFVQPGDIELTADAGQYSNLTIGDNAQFNGGNSDIDFYGAGDVNVTIGNDALFDDLTVRDGASTDLNIGTGATITDGLYLSHGDDNVEIGIASTNAAEGADIQYDIYTGDGIDSIEVGAYSNVGGWIELDGDAGDTISIGDNATIGGGIDAIDNGQTGTGATITIGDSVTMGDNLLAGDWSDDTVSIGDDFQMTGGHLYLEGGEDNLVIGNNANLWGGIYSSDGADDVTIGSGVYIGDDISLNGSGDNHVVIGDNAYITDFIFTNDGHDTIEIGANSYVGNEIELDGDIGDTITVGDNTTLNRGIDATDSGATGTGSQITFGDSVQVNDWIDTGDNSDDTLIIGNDFVMTSGGINTEEGDDSISIGDNATFSYANDGVYLAAGGGNDTLDLGVYDFNQGGYLDGESGTDTLKLTSSDQYSATDIENAIQNSGYFTQNPDGTYSAQDYSEFTVGSTTFYNWNGVDIVCFVKGTMIETIHGPLPIEDLQVGDLIETVDDGYQPLRWIGSRKIEASELAQHERLKPIRIREGAFGLGLPERDLLVSPQHRMLVNSKIARRMFDKSEVLIAAKQLLPVDGVDVVEMPDGVEYFHMLFNRHQLVIAEGAVSESLYTGKEALIALGHDAVKEIFTILPELRELDADELPVPARELVKGRLARKFAFRHVKNRKPLLESRLV